VEFKLFPPGEAGDKGAGHEQGGMYTRIPQREPTYATIGAMADGVAKLRPPRGRPLGGITMNLEVPIWQKYTLTVEEASQYFRIGENKLRKIISENENAAFLLWNGNRAQIKRKLFEKYIDGCGAI